MQKMRTLLANRKLLKRKLIDIENHIRGALRAYGLLVGAIARGAYEARIRELLERSDPIFAITIPRIRKWSALRAWGLRIAKRSSMLCAITAVARKLASILHWMWVSETEFHVGFGASPMRLSSTDCHGTRLKPSPPSPLKVSIIANRPVFAGADRKVVLCGDFRLFGFKLHGRFELLSLGGKPRCSGKRDSNSDRGTVKGALRRRLAGDDERRPATASNARNPYFIRRSFASWRRLAMASEAW
jgi:hypothetical protein